MIVGAVTEQTLCADLKAMLQEIIGSVHACNVGLRYVKCFGPVPERRELVECLSNYNKAIHAHRCLTQGNHHPRGLKEKEEENYESK